MFSAAWESAQPRKPPPKRSLDGAPSTVKRGPEPRPPAKIFQIDTGQGEDDTAVGDATVSRAAWTFLLAAVTLYAGAANAFAGQFKKAVYYNAGGNPWTLAAAHLTQSGNLDLAIADLFGGRVAILLGNGDGTFQTPRTFPVANPVEIATGDFNEDGNEDLAVTESNGTGDGSLAIFLGDGKGGFEPSASYPIGPASGFVAVADFNGDG